jgi:hypothetical protein
MDIRKAKAAFSRQKSGAALRGIGWELTFDQWLAWWGDDLDRRGQGHEQLQMQRLADTGPYRLDNVRKGNPRHNAKTYSLMVQKRNAEQARILKEALLDAAMHMPSVESKDELDDDQKFWRSLGYAKTSIKYA